MIRYDWLSPIRAALDSSDRPIPAFCRDDDVGWADPQLWPLIQTLSDFEVDLDLAVIPTAIQQDLAARMLETRRSGQARIHFHQHGYSHENHQSEGRKCEFGDARDVAAKRSDIEAGKALMTTCFQAEFDPVFTPPWNRCDQETVTLLEAAGYRVLSRDLGAQALDAGRLLEIPVTVDWCRRRDGLPVGLSDLATQIAGQIRVGQTLGLMFHHAVMDRYDLGAVEELLAVLCASRRMRWYSMMALAESMPPSA